MSAPATHTALFTTAAGGLLELRSVPTPTPGAGEILLRVEYTSSGPYDLHIADGWLLVDQPRVTGSAFAGTIHSVHSSVGALAPGDRVFGFLNGPDDVQRSHQEYAIVPAWRAAKLPAHLTLQEAVTVPENLVTIFQAASVDLGLELPWPRPEGDWRPEFADAPLLVWGGSGSVGQYAIQVFRHWGYRNILATASQRHHAHVRELGARKVFDYRRENVVEEILAETQGSGPLFVFDAVGHAKGTIAPISKIVKAGDRVAVVLPVVVRDATEEERPEYEMIAENSGSWKEGVRVGGIRAHFYQKNEMFKEKLLPEIVPALLGQRVVRPNKTRLVEGKDILERARNALSILRKKEQSNERLVWKVGAE